MTNSANEDGTTKVQSTGVMGAGVMGAGIAQVLGIAGLDVVCYDPDEAARTSGAEGIDTGRFGVRSAIERGKLTADEADAALARITFTGDVDEVAATDLIIEAVPENLALKIRVLRDLDGRCAPHTILCTNSSGLPVSAMAAATDRPSQVIGWHWASPAPVMKFAEIVKADQTSDETIATVVALATAAGKHPVVVGDTDMAWGYVANRIYFAMAAEAAKVVREGIATHEEVDQLMVDCYRWPVGPFGMTKGAGEGWK